MERNFSSSAKRPSHLQLNEENECNFSFNYPSAGFSEMSEQFNLSFSRNVSRPNSHSLNTSPTMSTPSPRGPSAHGYENYSPFFDWNTCPMATPSAVSANEFNSPELFGTHCQAMSGSPMPNEPPKDVFSPSLVRRPPLSQTLNQKVKYNYCVFCKNNGEDEDVFLAHTLKDDAGLVTCPILYNYQCPICGASGLVAHTIRYCPSNKDHSFRNETAHITVLKQMRTSTGQRKPAPGVIGGPVAFSVPPSRRPLPQLGGKNLMSALNMRGPNAAWSGYTTQPCVTPMVGEYLNERARQNKEKREQVNELLDFARSYQPFDG